MRQREAEIRPIDSNRPERCRYSGRRGPGQSARKCASEAQYQVARTGVGEPWRRLYCERHTREFAERYAVSMPSEDAVPVCVDPPLSAEERLAGHVGHYRDHGCTRGCSTCREIDELIQEVVG